MAVFSATTSSNKYITIELETRVDGQSVANNTTTISWWLRIKKSSSSTSATWGNCSYSANVGGQQKSGSGQVNVAAGGTTALLSGQVTVPHSSDGTLTISVSASISGKIVGSVSGTQKMTTIPRASTISAPAFTLGQAGTITIDRKSSSFTHTIQYWYGNTKGVTIANKTTATSVSWTPPMSLASETPSAVQGWGEIRCYTYSGNTQIGNYASIRLIINVPSSVVPSISAINVSEGVSGLAAQFGAYVQRKSRLRIQTGASGAYGSRISSCSVKVDGGTYSGTDVTSNSINSSGTVSITATVTDSRGRSASKTVSVSVTAYTAPAITALSAHRCNADGSYNTNGDYVYIDYAYHIAAVGNKNTHSATLSVKRSTGSDWTQVASNSAYSANTHVVPSQQFLSDYQFDVRLVVADYFDSTPMTVRLPSAETILDIRADGKGIATGKTAEEPDAFDSAWKIIGRAGANLYGKTVLEQMPFITTGTLTGDFNNYTTRGRYVQDTNSGMTGIANKPTIYAGVLYCVFPINDTATNLDGAWLYMLQIYVSYTGYIYLRYAKTDGNKEIDWGGWYEVLHTGNTSDYIIASGTSGIWTYRKWASGQAECWCTTIIGYANDCVLEGWAAFPFTFVAAPTTLATLGSNGDNYGTAISWNLKCVPSTTHARIDIHSPSAGFTSSTKLQVAIYAEGVV